MKSRWDEENYLFLKWKCQSWISSENDATTLGMMKKQKEMESDIFAVFFFSSSLKWWPTDELAEWPMIQENLIILNWNWNWDNKLYSISNLFALICANMCIWCLFDTQLVEKLRALLPFNTQQHLTLNVVQLRTINGEKIRPEIGWSSKRYTARSICCTHTVQQYLTSDQFV